jgi:hypothetical protein
MHEVLEPEHMASGWQIDGGRHVHVQQLGGAGAQHNITHHMSLPVTVAASEPSCHGQMAAPRSARNLTRNDCVYIFCKRG